MHRQGLAMKKKLLGNEHPDVAASLNNLAYVLAQQGKWVEAETMHREALAMFRKLLGNEHPYVATSLNNSAIVFAQQGKWAEAETMHREALAMRRKLLGNKHPDVAEVLAELTAILLAEEKYAEAEPLARECLDIREKILPQNWATFNVRSLLGGALLGQQKYADAEPLLLSGYEGMQQLADTIPFASKKLLKDSLQRLVQLYEATGQDDKARQSKEKLIEFDQTKPEKEPTQ